MFKFEFTGRDYSDQWDHQAAEQAAVTRAKQIFGDDFAEQMDVLSNTMLREDGPTDIEQRIWLEIEWAASDAGFAGWMETPDNMSLVWLGSIHA